MTQKRREASDQLLNALCLFIHSCILLTSTEEAPVGARVG